MNKRAWFIGFLILGLACCGWGMVQVKTTGEFVKGAKRARARVTYLDVKIESPDQKIESWHKANRYSSSVYRTVVFATHTGRQVVWQPLFTATVRTGGTRYRGYTHVPPDQTIEILYDPDAPNRFYPNSFFNLWMPAVLSVVGGLVLLGMATAVEMRYPVLEPFAMIFALIARSGRLRFGR